MVRQKYTREREGAYEIIATPNLTSKSENMPIMQAAWNGVIDAAVKKEKDAPHSLDDFLKNGWPNEELKKFILPYLFQLESQMKKPWLHKDKVIAYLIQQGAGTMGCLISKTTVFETLKLFAESGANFQQYYNGYTALHSAVTAIDHFHWKERIDLVLKQGVDPNQAWKSPAFGTALHIAIANEDFNNEATQSKAKYLIECLPNFQYDWNIQDGEEKTVLILAAKMRSTELVKLLLAKKKEKQLNLDLNKQDSKGRTALHFCCALGDAEGVKLLTEAGASCEIKDNAGRTPKAYTKLSKNVLCAILKEIHIDPDRDENATSNNIIGIDNLPISVKKTTKKKEELYALLARKIDGDAYSQILLKHIKKQAHPSEKFRQYDTGFLEIQLKFSGKSLIQACLDGQKKASEALEQAKNVSAALLSAPVASTTAAAIAEDTESLQKAVEPSVKEIAEDLSSVHFSPVFSVPNITTTTITTTTSTTNTTTTTAATYTPPAPY